MMSDKIDYIEFYEPDQRDGRMEDEHQVSCVAWLRVHHPYLLFWHTVNEGKKHIKSAMRDEEAGLLKGVADFVIIIGRVDGCAYQFGAIELKRTNKSGNGKASPVSKEQRAFLKSVRDRGGFAAVAYGTKQFKEAIARMIHSA